MGQAAVDLPDSIAQAKSTAPPMSADDLLAQLAGEEIDRLLADADTHSGTADDPLSPAAPDDQAVPQLQELLAVEKSQDGSAPAPQGKLDETISKAAADATAQVFYDAGSESSVAAATVPAIGEPPSTAPIAPTPAQPALAQPTTGPAINFGSSAADQATSTAERSALAPLPDDVDPEQQVAPDEQRPPLLVRVLEVINLPFEACPQVVRDALGKVAILTALNSIGVLLYVMLLRRH
jgi:hypothetical protein